MEPQPSGTSCLRAIAVTLDFPGKGFIHGEPSSSFDGKRSGEPSGMQPRSKSSRAGKENVGAVSIQSLKKLDTPEQKNFPKAATARAGRPGPTGSCNEQNNLKN